MAKAIVKAWAQEIPPELAGTALDLAKSQAEQSLRRKADSMSRLAAQLTRSMGEALALDGVALEEHEAESVAEELASSLESIDSALVARLALSPDRLARHLLDEAAPRIRTLSEVGASIFTRSLEKSCRVILSTASSLPRFQESTFAEVLEREARLLELSLTQLRETQRMAARAIRIESALLEHLEATREQWAARGLPYRTTSFLQDLLVFRPEGATAGAGDPARGFAQRCCDAVAPGFHAELREFIATLLAGQIAGEKERYTPFEWMERPDVMAAQELAHAQGHPFVSERELLIAVLRGNSSTLARITRWMGPQKFERLLRAAHATPRKMASTPTPFQERA
nr:hypothetical protein [Archangium lipolyticum]